MTFNDFAAGDDPVYAIDIAADRIDFTRTAGGAFSIGSSDLVLTFSFGMPISLSDLMVESLVMARGSAIVSASGNDLILTLLQDGFDELAFDDGAFAVTFTDNSTAVPLPATLPMLLGALAALGLVRLRRPAA